jgi:hypothetical protein
MKTLVILFSTLFFLNTTVVKSNTNELAKQKQNVRNQVVYALATSDIETKGAVTITFYVFDKKVLVQKVEGADPVLNQKVKERLEKIGFTRKGLTGNYSLTIKLNGAIASTLTNSEKEYLRDLMASNYLELRNRSLEEQL